MLTSYLTRTRALMQAPSSPIPLIPDATLIDYINQSRQQVAGQGLCVRCYTLLGLLPATRTYPFSSVTNYPAGVASIYDVRQLWYALVTGQQWIKSRPFEYFGYFMLNQPIAKNGPPEAWSQYGQGASGSLFIDPLPDIAYTCFADTVGMPIPLVDDTTIEVIPAIWTLAVPFYAAYWGFLSLQRRSDADAMMKEFQTHLALARNAANPDLLVENWSQSPQPTAPNQLGAQPARAG